MGGSGLLTPFSGVTIFSVCAGVAAVGTVVALHSLSWNIAFCQWKNTFTGHRCTCAMEPLRPGRACHCFIEDSDTFLL
ncbi:hypothetical protein KY285_013293 [Solanum tuberosum]|nr:hypothetical protein KY285_013293 [Solanum tuberosum]